MLHPVSSWGNMLWSYPEKTQKWSPWFGCLSLGLPSSLPRQLKWLDGKKKETQKPEFRREAQTGNETLGFSEQPTTTPAKKETICSLAPKSLDLQKWESQRIVHSRSNRLGKSIQLGTQQGFPFAKRRPWAEYRGSMTT